MRHAIVVVGKQDQREELPPKLALRDDEAVRFSTWYACTNQDDPSRLLEDIGSFIIRWMLVPVLAYRFYVLVHNTRLWAGKRPFVIIRDRGLSSRVAAFAGSWGGGDVVKVENSDSPPLGPTRFLLDADGNLKLHGD